MKIRYPKHVDRYGHAYTGEWKRGKKFGRGKCEYASGEVYDGDWKDDKKHGRGLFRPVSCITDTSKMMNLRDKDGGEMCMMVIGQ